VRARDGNRVVYNVDIIGGLPARARDGWGAPIAAQPPLVGAFSTPTLLAGRSLAACPLPVASQSCAFGAMCGRVHCEGELARGSPACALVVQALLIDCYWARRCIR